MAKSLASRGELLWLACLLAVAHLDRAQAAEAITNLEGASADTNSSQLQEVVVTARKRQERLQKVPIAITAFTPADLARNPVQGLTEVQARTPSLEFRVGTTDPFVAAVQIRGQYADDTNLVSQPSVGVYIDDVYQATTNALGPGNLGDVSQIEILKGAQGTLYGRNSTGGAIKVSTNIPQYENFGGKVKFGYGDYDQNEEVGVLNIPIIDNKVAMRISAEHYAHGGYGQFLDFNGNNTGKDVNDYDAKSYNGSFRFNPIDNLQLILRGDYTQDSSAGIANNLLVLAPNSPLVPAYGLASLSTAHPVFNITDALIVGQQIVPTAAQYGQFLQDSGAAYQALQKYVIPGGSYNAYSSDPNPMSVLRTGGMSLNGTYDFSDDLQLKNVTAYRRLYRRSDDDLIGTPPGVIGIEGIQGEADYNQITEELQLNGKLLDSKLKYTIGYFYYNLDGDYRGQDTAFPEFYGPAASLATNNADAHLSNTSNSVYGQGTYALTDKINFTGGLRWTTETSDELVSSYNGTPLSGGPAATPATDPLFACKILTQTSSGTYVPVDPCAPKQASAGYRNVSYSAGLDWSPTDNLLLYLKTNRGFKAGGINSNGTFNVFQPEIATDYELGAKSDWLNHTLRINAAVFHTDWNNVQRPVLVQLSGNLQTQIANATAEMHGVELETIYKPIENLEFRANGSYLYSHYLSFFSPNPQTNTLVDIKGNRFTNTPRWTGFVEAAYTYPLDFGNVRSSLDWIYTSDVWFSTNTPLNQYNIAENQQNSHSLWDARVTLNVDKYDLNVSLWVKNMTDKRYFQSAIDLTGTTGVMAGSLAPPRTFGFEITKYF